MVHNKKNPWVKSRDFLQVCDNIRSKLENSTEKKNAGHQGFF